VAHTHKSLASWLRASYLRPFFDRKII